MKIMLHACLTIKKPDYIKVYLHVNYKGVKSMGVQLYLQHLPQNVEQIQNVTGGQISQQQWSEL